MTPRADKPPTSCEGCYAWGQLPGRFCGPCYNYARNHPAGDCPGCRRSAVAVDEVHGYCRLCTAQATWAIQASGKTGQVLAPWLAGVMQAQLWFAGMQRPPRGGPLIGKQGRFRQPRPPAELPAPRLPGYLQLELFPATRDLGRFDRRRDADSTNPALIAARREAALVGAARGWDPAATAGVDRALVITLSGHTPGEKLTHRQLLSTLRRRGLPVRRTIAILDRLGLYHDDRTPALGVWLARQLDGIKPGIAAIVTGWALQLRHGGPRTKVHQQGTVWGYVSTIRPVLGRWSARYDHLREVTRADVTTARDTVTGKERESLLVALRSLFRYARQAGKVFTNPTTRVRVPRTPGGVLQPLNQAQIAQAVAVSTQPHTRLILALAAVHAARPHAIQAMQLTDVDLPNRRITIANHVRPLDDLTATALTGWLDHRRERWPNTANPHLLITAQTALNLEPASRNWITAPTRNLTANLERLRVDRQFEEALTHGPDPLHLTVMFGISDKTAIRYAESAKQILTTPIEDNAQRTQGPTPPETAPTPLGSR